MNDIESYRSSVQSWRKDAIRLGIGAGQSGVRFEGDPTVCPAVAPTDCHQLVVQRRAGLSAGKPGNSKAVGLHRLGNVTWCPSSQPNIHFSRHKPKRSNNRYARKRSHFTR